MMAKSWRDYKGQGSPCDNSDKSDKSPPAEPESAPNVPIVTNVTGLPADVLRGLTWLANAPPPARVDHERWPQTVADARLVASDGWAAKAMGLGWSALDLFGASMNGCQYGDGLAAWLRGRTLLALAETWAVARDEHGNRHYFNRPRGEGARLLWKLGR